MVVKGWAALLDGFIAFCITYAIVLVMIWISYEVQFWPMALFLTDIRLHLSLFYGVGVALTRI